jgi:hypothetical protein
MRKAAVRYHPDILARIRHAGALSASVCVNSIRKTSRTFPGGARWPTPPRSIRSDTAAFPTAQTHEKQFTPSSDECGPTPAKPKSGDLSQLLAAGIPVSAGRSDVLEPISP